MAADLDEDRQPEIAFWSQLQQRKVFRVAVSYAVLAFVVIQIADATFDALAIPSQAIPWLLAAMFFIFPFVVTIAWLYEITPSGLVLDTRFQRVAKPLEVTFIVGLFLLCVGIAASFAWLGGLPASERSRVARTQPTIAVLPFQNFGSDESAVYLGNGIADQLLRVLDNLKEFNVVGRTSSFYYGNQGLDFRTIGRALGADHIVEGSIILEGPRVLVTAQLIESESSLHVWSDKFERTLDSIIDLELEIADAIARSMSLALSDSSQQRLTQTATNDADAYLFYLQGKEYLRRPASRESLQFADELFGKSLAEDPQYIDAEVGLCQSRLALYRVTQATDVYRKALATCLKIASSDQRTAEAHVALGDLNRLVGNFVEAEVEFKTALELDQESARAFHGLARAYQGQGRLNLAETAFLAGISAEPSWAFGHRGYGFFLAQHSRFDEASEQFEKATELTPDDTNALSNLGQAYFDGGNWDKAQEAWLQALSIKRVVPVLVNYATLSYYQKDYHLAASLLEEARAIAPTDYRVFGKMGATHRQLGDTERSREAFQQAIRSAEEVLSVRSGDSSLMSSLAGFYANVGNFERADQLLVDARDAGPKDSNVPYYEAVVARLAGRGGVAESLRRAAELGYSERLLDVDPLFNRVDASGIVEAGNGST
ncbi:MAG: tetratricopeptide repeat protein [Gammaproteobacteria bacterium]|nr:tetratricopeptide repeat protein [Gammaproteobacteria bacterium]